MRRNNVYQKLGLILGSILFTAIVLEIGLNVGGPLYLLTQDYRNALSQRKAKNDKQADYRILCLGESTTAFGGNDSYPRQLERLLNENSTRQFVVINKGVPATTSDQIVKKITQYLNTYRPQMVITMMGVNDTATTPAFQDEPDQQKFIFKLKSVKLIQLLWQNMKHRQTEIRARQNHTADLNHALNNVVQNPTGENVRALAKAYDVLEQFHEEEQALLKALERNPEDFQTRAFLGSFYLRSQDYPQAVNQFAATIATPSVPGIFKVGILSALAECYTAQKEYSMAEHIYKSLLRTFPESDVNSRVLMYDLLIELYLESAQPAQAITAFQQRIALNPLSIAIHMTIARAYRELKRYDELSAVLLKALELHPKNSEHYHFLYSELGYGYLDQQQYAKARAVFAQLQEINSKDEKAIHIDVQYGMNLAEKGIRGEPPETDPATPSLKNYYFPGTAKNYHLLKEKILHRGITFIAIQYPLRPLKPLKDLLHSDPRIIFVDNEQSFKNALAASHYSHYFIDHFGGDFGHCTQAGNALLAKNIAAAIQEVQP